MPDTTIHLPSGPTNRIDGQLAPLGPRPRRSIPVWRRRWVVLASLAVLLVVSAAVARLVVPSTAPPVANPAPVTLLAHGQVTPAHQARVGTQAGGVVQQLSVGVGARVLAQTPLAWVRGPSGTEVVTAPFNGTVTNVFVHEGDTLAPAATVAVVADLQSLQVESNDVDEFLIAHVALGEVVQVSVDALDNATLQGRVTSVAMLPEPSTGSAATHYPVTINLEWVPSDVRAGMSVRIMFPN